MTRQASNKRFVASPTLKDFGLTPEIIAGAIDDTHSLLDALDSTLTEKGEMRMAELLELANFSAIVGNLFRSGVAKHSEGVYKANGPHKYPDLLSNSSEHGDIEIKVALEKNKPKGHLVKPGPHIAVRYVLAAPDGSYSTSTRGSVPWIWEVRVGQIEKHHFNVSNTAGDSGKTATINKEGMEALKVVYCDLERCPYPPRGPNYKGLASMLKQEDEKLI